MKKEQNSKSCLLCCCSSPSLSCSSTKKEIILLIQQFNILECDDKKNDISWICEDCSKLLVGIGTLQKQVEQIQEQINRAVLTLKTIVRISHPKKSKYYIHIFSSHQNF
jgi:hypothetical protein